MSIYFGGRKGIPSWIQTFVYDCLFLQLGKQPQQNDDDDNNNNDNILQQQQYPTKMAQVLEISNRNKNILLISDGHHSIIAILDDKAESKNTTRATTTTTFDPSLHRGSVISIANWNVQARTIMDGEQGYGTFYDDPLYKEYAFARNNNNDNPMKLAVHLRASRVICQGGQDLALAAKEPIQIMKDIDIRRVMQAIFDNNNSHNGTQETSSTTGKPSPAILGILTRAQNHQSSTTMYNDNTNFLVDLTEDVAQDIPLGNVAALFPKATLLPNIPNRPDTAAAKSSNSAATSPPSTSSMPLGKVSKLFKSLTLQRHVIPELYTAAQEKSKEQRREAEAQRYDAILRNKYRLVQHHDTRRLSAAAAADNGETPKCSATRDGSNSGIQNSHNFVRDKQPSQAAPQPSQQLPQQSSTQVSTPSSKRNAPAFASGEFGSPSTTTTSSTVTSTPPVAMTKFNQHESPGEFWSCGTSTDDDDDEIMGIDDMLVEAEHSNDYMQSNHNQTRGEIGKESCSKSLAANEKLQNSASSSKVGILRDVESNTRDRNSLSRPFVADPSNAPKITEPPISRNIQWEAAMEGAKNTTADAIQSPPPRKKKKKFQFGADSIRAFLL